MMERGRQMVEGAGNDWQVGHEYSLSDRWWKRGALYEFVRPPIRVGGTTL